MCLGAQAGKMLLMVTANDIDIEPRLTYDLLTSTELFAVDKYSGKLSLTGKLDYETQTSHNLTVMVGNRDFCDDNFCASGIFWYLSVPPKIKVGHSSLTESDF